MFPTSTSKKLDDESKKTDYKAASYNIESMDVNIKKLTEEWSDNKEAIK